MPKVGDETKAAKEEPSSAGASETIIYNGAVMNIAQLLEQVAKAEVDRNNAVQQLDLLEAQLSEYKLLCRISLRLALKEIDREKTVT